MSITTGGCSPAGIAKLMGKDPEADRIDWPTPGANRCAEVANRYSRRQRYTRVFASSTKMEVITRDGTSDAKGLSFLNSELCRLIG